VNGKIKIGILALAVIAASATLLLLRRAAVAPREPTKPQESVMVSESVLDSARHSGEPSLLEQLRSQAEAVNAVPEEEREEARVRLVKSFSQVELPGLLQALGKATDPASVELRQLLLRRWAASDPWAAANWAANVADVSSQRESLRQVGLVWAQTDLPQTIQWAQSWLDTEQRQSVCLALANEAVRTDPQTALTLAADLSLGQGSRNLVIHAAAQWAVADPAAAAAWAGQIEDVGLRDQVMSGIATEWSSRDPVAAATLALQSISAGQSQDNALVGIVQRWAETDPETVANWVLAFPAGSLQQSALENLVKPWARQDAGQAGDWLNTLAGGTVRDTSVAAYATAIAPGTPDAAAEWAASIAQETIRVHVLNAVVKGWLVQDSASAQMWITESSLVTSEKTQLLALVGN